VIETGCSLLEQRRHDRRIDFHREIPESIHSRSRDLFGKIKIFMVLYLTKIDGGKDLRETDDFGSLRCGFPYLRLGPINVLLPVDRAAHLNQPKLKHTIFFQFPVAEITCHRL
jgi:hypothetical protein